MEATLDGGQQMLGEHGYKKVALGPEFPVLSDGPEAQVRLQGPKSGFHAGQCQIELPEALGFQIGVPCGWIRPDDGACKQSLSYDREWRQPG